MLYLVYHVMYDACCVKLHACHICDVVCCVPCSYVADHVICIECRVLCVMRCILCDVLSVLYDVCCV